MADNLIPDDVREQIASGLDQLTSSLNSARSNAPDIRKQWADMTHSVRQALKVLYTADARDIPAVARATALLADLREAAVDAALDGALDPTPRLPSIPASNAHAISTMPCESERGWSLRHLAKYVSARVALCALFTIACVFVDVVVQVLIQHYTNRLATVPSPTVACSPNAPGSPPDTATAGGGPSSGPECVHPPNLHPPPPYHLPTGGDTAARALDDLGFVALGWTGLAHRGAVADTFVYGSVITSLLCIVPTRRGAQAMCRWMILLGSLFFLRGLTIGVTLLPNPLHTCQTKVEFGDHIDSIDPANPFALFLNPAARNEIFIHAVRVMTLQDVTCSDVLYSGHTVNSMLACMFAMAYAAGVSKRLLVVTIVRCFFVALLVATPVVIVATRLHYTCDVLLGAVLTVLSYKLYHTRLALAATCPTSFPLLRRIEGLDLRVCAHHEH